MAKLMRVMYSHIEDKYFPTPEDLERKDSKPFNWIDEGG